MTPEQEKKNIEKIHKQQRSIVQKTINRLLMQFSFGNIKTWDDVYKTVGYDESYIAANFSAKRNLPVTIVELKAFNQSLKDDLEKQLSAGANKPQELPMPPSNAPVVASISSTVEQPVIAPATFKSVDKIDSPDAPDSRDDSSNDYGLWPSSKEKAFLYYFQKRATKEILDIIL